MSEKRGNRLILTGKGINIELDKSTGQPICLQDRDMSVSKPEIYVDVGCDGKMEAGFLDFDCLDDKRTWELPIIRPIDGGDRSWTFTGCDERDGIARAAYRTKKLEITVTYGIRPGNICISAQLRNITDKRQIINGAAFMIRDNGANQTTAFEFPGNVPCGLFAFRDLKEGQIIETGLVNPVIHTNTERKNLNILFLDDQEKWGTGVYRRGKNQINFVNFAAVESYLEPDETLSCGNIYLQLIGEHDPYLPVRELYESLGYMRPQNGVSDGVLYSCHPAGTMDSDFPYTSGYMGDDFPYHGSMYEYADELDRLKSMGIDHVWVLPIFEHLDRGVYSPTDQSVIDERYGGDEAVRYFCDRAHQLGMTVLFDYVPHGPQLGDPLAAKHMEWCSKKRDGEPQTEWECVSFDMANPDYQRYTKDMVRDHVRRFGIDGARIDCAMGGLSNWEPYDGNRPSNSNLNGGVAISRSIREAFVEEGKIPTVVPENFNPVPFYYPYTDLFYDMPLYRTLYELEKGGISPEEFAGSLTRWLNAELLTTPEGYHKMRFLGNHDTVSWVFFKTRAPKVYGVDKAKALWALISLIDGVPMLYQGDEDPKLYNGEGPELREFFSGLFGARKKYLGNKYSMEYEFTGTSVIAFNRSYNGSNKKILINMSPDRAAYHIKSEVSRVLYGDCRINGGSAELDGYGYALLEIG